MSPYPTLPRNFELSSLIHQLAGKPANAGWDSVENQRFLIEEEFKEFRGALLARDPLKLRDAIGDLLMTVYGAAYRAGLPADEDLVAIFESNMTKFDRDAETAALTRAKYAQLGLEVETICVEHGAQVFYTTRVTKPQTVAGKYYPRGKLVKSVNFKEPVFSQLPSEVAVQLEPQVLSSGG